MLLRARSIEEPKRPLMQNMGRAMCTAAVGCGDVRALGVVSRAGVIILIQSARFVLLSPSLCCCFHCPRLGPAFSSVCFCISSLLLCGLWRLARQTLAVSSRAIPVACPSSAGSSLPCPALATLHCCPRPATLPIHRTLCSPAPLSASTTTHLLQTPARPWASTTASRCEDQLSGHWATSGSKSGCAVAE